MLSASDFNKKQIVFVMFNEGEKMVFGNDNLIVKQSDGKIRFKCTCYRLFAVYAVGHCSLTSAIIQKAKKFGFFIIMMTSAFRVYTIIGAEKEGNTLLRKSQYMYSGNEIARHIIKNKIRNQRAALMSLRNKNDYTRDAIKELDVYAENLCDAETLSEIMGYEGLSAKMYFRAIFSNTEWRGRKPRIKSDFVNSTLDIGYTLLFTYIDSLLMTFGFDTFCGVLHRQFYMRKSLTCDIVEPFRCIVDVQVRKAINLRQIKKDDFIIANGQYRLKWESSPPYVQLLMEGIIHDKDKIFAYIQDYYRCFMKQKSAEDFPVYIWSGEK